MVLGLEHWHCEALPWEGTSRTAHSRPLQEEERTEAALTGLPDFQGTLVQGLQIH